jgi:hypothetical protein
MSYRHTIENGGDAVTIRRARPADATALRHLAALDEAEPLAGDAIVAEVDGELWAAIGVDGGRTISDPFRPAAHARELLQLRAAMLGRPSPSGIARRTRIVTSLLRER